MDRIAPELLVYRQSRRQLDISYDTNGSQAVDLMIANDLLPAKRVVFIAHGFRTDKHKPWLHLMKDRMIGERDQTVVIVGWGGGADLRLYNYEQAAVNALAVGQWLAQYFVAIKRRFEDSVAVWAVGHSLGAHLMGAAGRASAPGALIDRITGLDPAGLGFQVENFDVRLQKTDAKLVDVIHTDGKAVPYYGTLAPLGSLDFYPNYGWNQPTNDSPDSKPYMYLPLGDDPKGPVNPLGSGFTVSHTRAIDYFIWSINNKGKFITNWVLDGEPGVELPVHRLKRVDAEAEMGYYADEHRYDGLMDTYYYVVTNASEPWI